jgi:hypothetical protein
VYGSARLHADIIAATDAKATARENSASIHPLTFHADGRVFTLTSWVTCDLPDRLPLVELMVKLASMKE